MCHSSNAWFGTTATGQHLIKEVIRRGLNWNNACCHSIENLLSSRLLSKDVKLRIYNTIILPVVLYGCETWSLTLRMEHRLRVFEKRVLWRIFGPKRDEVTGEWKKTAYRGTSCSVFFAKYNQNNQVEEDEIGEACSTSGEEERV
jgi:hypothetical protein